MLMVFLLYARLAPARPLTASPGADVTMTAVASPSSVPAGGLVSYSVALINRGDQAANNLAITAVRPAGFSYVAGSAEISFNGIASLWPCQNPTGFSMLPRPQRTRRQLSTLPAASSWIASR